MKTNVRFAALAVAALLLTGCASTHMMEVPEGQRVTKPEPGKALVYLVRATSFGGAIQSTVYDNDRYVGTISANTHLAYQATPGQHMFMIIGESADFMQAELLPNKIYYALVQPRVGVWKARFSFRPDNGQFTDAEKKEWLSSTRQVVPNAEGEQWAKDNDSSVKEKKAEYLPKWNEKPLADRQILKAESGK